MKVHIEFYAPEPGADPESFYESVHFLTGHAGSANEWGEAVLDFVRSSNWTAEPIILSALSNVDLLDENLKRSYWLKRNREMVKSIRDDLTELLESSNPIP
tara:strand:+ start:277 stop:579 length:303 start_codon:yes stop_codon:yes gene_type:complete